MNIKINNNLIVYKLSEYIMSYKYLNIFILNYILIEKKTKNIFKLFYINYY